jgi:hypothetical protein
MGAPDAFPGFAKGRIFEETHRLVDGEQPVAPKNTMMVTIQNFANDEVDKRSTLLPVAKMVEENALCLFVKWRRKQISDGLRNGHVSDPCSAMTDAQSVIFIPTLNENTLQWLIVQRRC